MKLRNLLIYASGLVTLLFTTQCEGPAGADGHVTCLECHAEDQIIEVQVQFKQSAHKGGLIAVDYAGGRESCAQCHSHEGFLDFATFGGVDGDISGPSAWECATCHGIHSTFEKEDYALRLSSAVNFISDTTLTFDHGKSNLCANCHQARTAEPNTAKPGATFNITSTHYGPHHGPQANLVEGVLFAEIAGSAAYPEKGSHPHAGVSCVGCHMSDYTEGTGGHTYNPNIQNCKQCHSSITSLDHKGFQTETMEKLEELQALLLAQDVIAPEVDGDDTIGYHPVTGEHTMVQSQAYFNYIGIEEDRSLGVHNPAYIGALLDNTIEAVK